MAVTWRPVVASLLLAASSLKLWYVWCDVPDPWAAQPEPESECSSSEEQDSTAHVRDESRRRRGPSLSLSLSLLPKLFLCNIEDFARYWNRYEVHNAQQLRGLRGGRLLVGYHSRPTLDLVFFFSTLKPRIIVHYLAFKIPLLAEVLASLGVVSSQHGGLDADECFVEAVTARDAPPLVLLPGGRFECIKRHEQRYRVLWKEVPGFARVLCKYRREVEAAGGVSVIPFFTTNCEEVYWHSQFTYNASKSLVDWTYASFLSGNVLVLPFMMSTMLFSLGFILLPRRIKLDTYLGEPVRLQENESAEEFAARVQAQLQQLIEERQNPAKCSGDQLIRSQSLADATFSSLYGSYTLLQNLSFTAVLVATFWASSPFICGYEAVRRILK